MSVYIKGMKKPKDRYSCPLFTKEHICMANGIKCIVGSGSGVPKYCPVKELPEPHGRLVDYEEINAYYWEDADGYHVSVEAETVIEAEE